MKTCLLNNKYFGMNGIITYQAGVNKITVDQQSLLNHSIAMRPTHLEIKKLFVENFDAIEKQDRMRVVLKHMNLNVDPGIDTNQTNYVYSGLNDMFHHVFPSYYDVIPEKEVGAVLNSTKKLSSLAERKYKAESLDISQPGVVNDIRTALEHSESISKTIKYKAYANSDAFSTNFVGDMDMVQHSDLVNLVALFEQKGILGYLCVEHNIAIIVGGVAFLNMHRLLLIPGNCEYFIKDSLRKLERKLSIRSLFFYYNSNLHDFKTYFIPILNQYIFSAGKVMVKTGVVLSVGIHVYGYMYPDRNIKPITNLYSCKDLSILAETLPTKTIGDVAKEGASQAANYAGDFAGGVVGGFSSGFISGFLRSKIDVLSDLANSCDDAKVKEGLKSIIDFLKKTNEKK